GLAVAAEARRVARGLQLGHARVVRASEAAVLLATEGLTQRAQGHHVRAAPAFGVEVLRRDLADLPGAGAQGHVGAKAWIARGSGAAHERAVDRPRVAGAHAGSLGPRERPSEAKACELA